MKQLQAQCEVALSRGRFDSKRDMQRHFRHNVRKEYAHLYTSKKCHPFLGPLTSIFVLPIFASMTYAMRAIMFERTTVVGGKLELIPNVSFTDGGVLFFKNLLEPDPTLILPVLRLVFTLLNIELNVLKVEKQTKSMLAVNWLSRIVALWMFYVSTLLPCGIVYYWFLSSTFSFMQQILLLNPKVRKFWNIPAIENDRSGWKNIVRRANHRYLRKSNVPEILDPSHKHR